MPSVTPLSPKMMPTNTSTAMSDARYQVPHIYADNSYTDYLEAM